MALFGGAVAPSIEDAFDLAPQLFRAIGFRQNIAVQYAGFRLDAADAVATGRIEDSQFRPMLFDHVGQHDSIQPWHANVGENERNRRDIFDQPDRFHAVRGGGNAVAEGFDQIDDEIARQIIILYDQDTRLGFSGHCVFGGQVRPHALLAFVKFVRRI
jgi:hypothetical protein